MGDNKLAEPSKFEYTDSRTRKPHPPRRQDRPVQGLVTSKNFITCNAVENILAVPKKTDVRQVPRYLEKVKAEIEDEYNYIQSMQEAYEEEGDEGSRTRALDVNQKMEMIDGLKTNWDRINKAYQTLSFTLDTPAKKQRKEEFEAQLEQIERDIERLSKGSIFVEDEQQDYGY